jgi:hypothetical protein
MYSNKKFSNEHILDFLVDNIDNPLAIKNLFLIAQVKQKFKQLLDYYKPRGEPDLNSLTNKTIDSTTLTHQMINFIDSLSETLVNKTLT